MRTTALLLVVLGAIPAAAGIADINGDGIAVTFDEHDDLGCPPGGDVGQIRVRVEFDPGSPSDGPTGPPGPVDFLLFDDNSPGADSLLMHIRLPAATAAFIGTVLGGPGQPPSSLRGVFHLVFPLSCSDSCGVEGRFDGVGENSTFQPAPIVGPAGPSFDLGQVGRGGGPLGEGLDIIAVGNSGEACVDLAISDFNGPPLGGGDDSLCCGNGTVPAASWRGLVALSAALLALATYVLMRRRPARVS